MSCFRPWYRELDTGRIGDGTVRLPCGKCKGCITDRAHAWGVRVTHEAAEHSQNVFVTLTYDDKHLPYGGSLYRRDVQLFLKKLRKYAGKRRIRYFGCGEYGERTYRPHYHLCLFNAEFKDRVRYDLDHDTSDTLSELWTQGSHKVADLTVRRCYYTAGYAAKKLGRRGDDYDVVDFDTGEVLVEREKEFVMCSLRPAIGQKWFDRYQSDLKLGHLVHDGKKVPIPRFYLKKFEKANPELFDMTFRNGIPRAFDEDRAAAAEVIFAQKQSLFRKPLLTENAV